MKARSLARWLATLGVVALFVPGSASAEEVRVMISAGFYAVYAELGPAFERASGHRLITTRGPSMGDSPEAIPTRLARGEPAELQPGSSFAGAITSAARQPDAALALLRFLASPDAASTLLKNGLTPPARR